VSFARYADRHKIAPRGLFGGHDGATGTFVLNPGTSGERPLKSKGLDVLQTGDLVSLRLPGAGGYGDPRERSLSAIERDLRDGKVSIEAAQTRYGVTVDRHTLAVRR
jgi:N-methylhydantoinase B